MKHILYILSAALLVCACEKSSDNDNEGGYKAPYTLSADKTEVEADGKEIVTFSLRDADGADILSDTRAAQSVNIISDEGLRVPRLGSTLSFIANGTYNFKARYNGQYAENTVQVTAKNRGRYEKYHKNVAIYKATGTWCPYCPAMTTSLERMNEDTKAHSVELAWHNSDDFSIVLPGNINDCGALVAAFLNNGKAAYPTVVLDLQKMITERSTATLESAIRKLRVDYPATSGIKLETSYKDGEAAGSYEVSVKAEMTTSTGGEYDLGVALLLNDQVGMGGTAENGAYTHIVRWTTPNYLGDSGDFRQLAKDESVSFEHGVECMNMDIDDLTVVAFTLKSEDSKVRIDNIVEIKVGKSLDYKLND